MPFELVVEPSSGSRSQPAGMAISSAPASGRKLCVLVFLDAGPTADPAGWDADDAVAQAEAPCALVRPVRRVALLSRQSCKQSRRSCGRTDLASIASQEIALASLASRTPLPLARRAIDIATLPGNDSSAGQQYWRDQSKLVAVMRGVVGERALSFHGFGAAQLDCGLGDPARGRSSPVGLVIVMCV